MNSSKFRLIIQASNINQGGGGSLLISLIKEIPGNLEVLALLDSRMEKLVGLPDSIKVTFIKPTIFHRAYAQWWLYRNVNLEDTVLCFGSLPPLFRLRAKTVVFIQNRYLITNHKLEGFDFKTRFRLIFERFRLRICASNANEFIVQSISMKRTLLNNRWFKKSIPINIVPFILNAEPPTGKKTLGNISNPDNINKYDFLYPAFGDPHKNHLNLIEAWCLLANQNIFPSLCLTINNKNSAKLCLYIEQKKVEYCLNIVNVGEIPRERMAGLYLESKALIFPSILESFGLPLIEAQHAGLPILASELDYVRDFIDPEQSFDPHSALSIARAVKRFLGVNEVRAVICNGSQFLALLCGIAIDDEGSHNRDNASNTLDTYRKSKCL